ncbi:hypothetical protein RHSIM_Rhsim01G0069800 [Rhododendron simsii]|uniref:Uncharacterized protein n=1 Tax=Rhododendron simsii TaxID=118357 RepID=A0A834HRR6_RHOSS|nr:hypothetical protein RHSIM_Rhsim01G0069800 [Rhododendron simsii]
MIRCLLEISRLGIQNLPNKLPLTSDSKIPTLSTCIAVEESTVPIEVPQPHYQRTLSRYPHVARLLGCWSGEKSLEDACTELRRNIDRLGMYITTEKDLCNMEIEDLDHLFVSSHSLEIWAHFPNLQAGDLAGDADNSSPTVVLDKLAQTFRSSICQGSFPS